MTASSDHTTRLWDTASGQALAQLEWNDGYAERVAFSPNGTRILPVASQTALLFDASSGEAVAVLEGHESLVTDATFSPDGTRVVTASYDGTARL